MVLWQVSKNRISNIIEGGSGAAAMLQESEPELGRGEKGVDSVRVIRMGRWWREGGGLKSG